MNIVRNIYLFTFRIDTSLVALFFVIKKRIKKCQSCVSILTVNHSIIWQWKEINGKYMLFKIKHAWRDIYLSISWNMTSNICSIDDEGNVQIIVTTITHSYPWRWHHELDFSPCSYLKELHNGCQCEVGSLFVFLNLCIEILIFVFSTILPAVVSFSSYYKIDLERCKKFFSGVNCYLKLFEIYSMHCIPLIIYNQEVFFLCAT